MSDKIQIDLSEVNLCARRLSDAAERLGTMRPDLLRRLAQGAGERPVLKSRDNVKVTIGAAPYEHSGSRAGDIVAQRLKSCGDGFQAVEDGLRALGAVITALAARLEANDVLTQEDIDTLVAEVMRSNPTGGAPEEES